MSGTRLDRFSPQVRRGTTNDRVEEMSDCYVLSAQCRRSNVGVDIAEGEETEIQRSVT